MSARPQPQVQVLGWGRGARLQRGAERCRAPIYLRGVPGWPPRWPWASPIPLLSPRSSSPLPATAADGRDGAPGPTPGWGLCRGGQPAPAPAPAWASSLAWPERRADITDLIPSAIVTQLPPTTTNPPPRGSPQPGTSGDSPSPSTLLPPGPRTPQKDAVGMLQGQWHQLEPPAFPNSPQSTAPAVPPSRTWRSTRRHEAPSATGEGLRSARGDADGDGSLQPCPGTGQPGPQGELWC